MQNLNKAIQDSNNYTVCDICCESNYETFCKYLLGKLNSTVCPLKCESCKERSNNCPSLLNGDNNNNCETSAILLRESNRQKSSNNGVLSNSISQSKPENSDPINQDEVHYNDLFVNSEYNEIDDVNGTTINFHGKAYGDSLFTLHFNVSSFPENIDKLSVFVRQLAIKPDVIAITETKLNIINYNSNLNLTSYVFIHKIRLTRAGGVGFYINEELSYSCQDNNINLNLNFVEDMWIKIEAKPYPIFIGVIYCHPVNTVDKIEQFGDALFGTMHDLNLKSATYFVLGDFNLDLMNISCKNNAIQKYASYLLGCSCKCLMNMPTRITQTSKTLIDHIYTIIHLYKCKYVS